MPNLPPWLWLSASAVAMALGISGQAAETQPLAQPGIESIRLVSSVDCIQPGQPFHVGLVIQHRPGYHTYWKNPGIVGVATSFLWQLPSGFEAGKIQWPAPQTTKMASYTAWGYEGETCLVVEIRPPAVLPAADAEGKLWIKTRAIWMCCATECNPGWEDFALPLAVAKKGDPGAKDAKNAKNAALIERSLARVPVPSPEGWQYAASPASSEAWTLTVTAPAGQALTSEGAYFFSFDHLVDSHAPQAVRGEPEGSLVLTLPRPPHAPESATALRGVLRLPGQTPEYREISVPLP